MKGFFSRRLPKIRDNTKTHRRVSWLDLFFDLMFVLILRDFFYFLGGDLTIDIFLNIALFFIPVWLVRHSYNFYVHRFEESTIRHRVMTFLLMGCIGVYSYSIHDTGMVVNDLLLYGAVGAHYLLGYLFISATKNPKNTKVSKTAIIIGVAHILFAIAWFIQGLWVIESNHTMFMAISSGLFLLVIGLLPILAQSIPPIQSNHLGERFGLFIIIVLAELIYGLLEGLSDATIISANVVGVTVGGFLIGVAIRRMYFDVIGHNPLRKTSLQYITLWSLLHLPLSLGIIYLGGMFLHIIFQVSSEFIQTELMFVTGLLVLMIVIIIGLLSFFHVFEWKPRAEGLNLPESFPGILMISISLLLGIVFRLLQLSEPITLVMILLVFFGVTIFLFHYFFDPLDLDESFE